MRRFLEVFVCLCVALFVESLFKRFHIPVTVIDLLLFAISALVVFLIVSHYFSDRSSVVTKKRIGSKRLLNLLTFVSVCFFVLLALSIIYLGVSEPLTIFTGVKGAAHGYTLVITGVTIIFVTVSGIYFRVSSKNA